MITANEGKLTEVEQWQLDRREMAVGSWAQGDLENAEILLDSVLVEPMTPRVAVQCYVSKAAFRGEASDFAGSLTALERAAAFLDAADLRFQGAFYNQRARIHNRLGNIDAALTDYAGASACFEAAEDRSYEGAALLNIAELYFQKNDLVRARENVDRALAALIESGSEYLPQGFETLASIELEEGRLEQAVNAISKAFEMVGNNELWRQAFLKTRDKIDQKLRQVSRSLHSVNVEMVKWALISTGGNLTRAGKLTGLTHKGVSYIVDRHQDLEPFRAKRRTRTHLKSILKDS